MARRKSEQLYIQLLTVRMSQVPFDMFRYDSCVPHTEREAAKLERIANGTADANDHVVILRRYSLTSDKPTEDRWKSFGCRVLAWGPA